ncbi:MAG: hypothetical protein Tsb009_08560 [Planctomycetaceae bacterium]
MRALAVASLVLLVTFNSTLAQKKQAPAKDPSRVLPAGEVPKDPRLGKPRTLRDAYHPWKPPTTKAAWLKERERLLKQVLVSQGLWPMPPKTPLKAVIHGKIERDDYTVEKVYFQSHPGHYVTGNLYRPKKSNGKRKPGVLCPHGHWSNARFYDAGEKNAKKLIAGGGESFVNAARHHIQARMVGLARLGCVVFHYDMVGYSDSKVIGHRQGFTDAEASLRLQNFMGLQTWNSIRALDFLTSLPDVDTKRIGITGASGGGTQTFMLAAIDPRISVAFPAVMVSTGMQGGCICENAEYLRIGINNIALAALFAPKPQAMSGADDWTKEIETKGYPELRQVYSLYGKPENISAKAFPQFKHNYNQVAREMMYEWFNEHLKLGHKSPIKERDFNPISAAELSVWTADHPQPKDAKSAAQLRKYLTEVSEKQFEELIPKTKAVVKRYREIVGGAAEVMFGGRPDGSNMSEIIESEKVEQHSNIRIKNYLILRKKENEHVPVVIVSPTGTKYVIKEVLMWIKDKGRMHIFDKNHKLTSPAQKVINTGRFLSTASLFDKFTSPNGNYVGYTFGYNYPLISNRVRDSLTIFAPKWKKRNGKIVLAASGEVAPSVLLASGLIRDRLDKIIIDLNGFSFSKIKSTSDPNFLPGALKYGGIGGLAALAAPTELVIYGTKGIPQHELAPLIQMYKVTGGKLTLHPGKLTDDLVVEEVLKK